VVRDLLLRLGGGLVEFGWGVNAERRSLEEVAAPLSATQQAASTAAFSGLTDGLTAHVRRGPGADEPVRRGTPTPG
jgi:hypothetical protein